MSERLLRGFTPVRFRTAFLLGAAWMTVAALAAAGYAIHGVVVGSLLQVGFNGSLALVLALAVHGLLRMRTWGLMLGGLISCGLLALAPFYGSANAVTLTLAAIPALALWLVPVLLARRQPARRVAVSYRVAPAAATADASALPDDFEDPEGSYSSSSSSAARMSSRVGVVPSAR